MKTIPSTFPSEPQHLGVSPIPSRPCQPPLPSEYFDNLVRDGQGYEESERINQNFSISPFNPSPPPYTHPFSPVTSAVVFKLSLGFTRYDRTVRIAIKLIIPETRPDLSAALPRPRRDIRGIHVPFSGLVLTSRPSVSHRA